jgi:hypothetical protein
MDPNNVFVLSFYYARIGIKDFQIRTCPEKQKMSKSFGELNIFGSDIASQVGIDDPGFQRIL